MSKPLITTEQTQYLRLPTNRYIDFDEAAGIMGVSRVTAWRRVKKYYSNRLLERRRIRGGGNHTRWGYKRVLRRLSYTEEEG